MSSSLELKEVSFMSCYGTRRLCLSGVMRSGLGEQGEQGAGPSPGGDQQWGSQSGFCVAAVGCVFGNYPPLYEHRPGFPGEIPTQPAHGRVHNTPSTKINFSQCRRDAWLGETRQIYETLSCATCLWWVDLQSQTVSDCCNAQTVTPVELTDRNTCKPATVILLFFIFTPFVMWSY